MINIISYIRHRLGLSISELAKATGLTNMDISRMENGYLKCGIEKFITLARFFKVPVDPLVRNMPERVIKVVINNPGRNFGVSEKRMAGERSRIRIGDLGEDIALEFELSRHIKVNSPYLELIDPTCASKPSNGFDIMSRTLDGRKLMIEVKTSGGGLDSKFYITKTELNRAKKAASDGDVYMIYRVIHATDMERCTVVPLTSEELFCQFEMAPESYAVTPI